MSLEKKIKRPFRPTTHDPRLTTVKAPAKINLFLEVSGKRHDGYHDIVTLFERVSLYDELVLRPAPSGICLSCRGGRVEAGPSNLVWKAAELLQRKCGVRRGVSITLTKRIPVAAGLGGGSSDAAAALSGLNRFWRLGLSARRLGAIALELGSDVPFFLAGSAFALGKGRGEKLRPVRAARLWHVLAFPGLKIGTREVYEALTRSDYGLKISAARFVAALKRKDLGAIAPLALNALERPVFRRHPLIRRLKEEFIRAGAVTSLMSGSGSTVFAIARSERHAGQITRRMRRAFPKVRFCTVQTA